MKQCKVVVEQLTTLLEKSDFKVSKSNEGSHLNEVIDVINNVRHEIEKDTNGYQSDDGDDDTESINIESRNDENTNIELECEEERENDVNDIENEIDNEDEQNTNKSDCHPLALCDIYKEGMKRMLAVDIPMLRLKRKNRIHRHNSFIIELFDKLSKDESIVDKTLNEIEKTINDEHQTAAYMNKMRSLRNKIIN